MGIVILALAALALVLGLELNQRRNRRRLPGSPSSLAATGPKDRDLERVRAELLSR